MCVAIVKPKGVAIRTAHFASCFKANPHGAGFAIARGGGKVEVSKGFFNVEDFFKAWDATDTRDFDALIHFRVATHGKISKDNCHPFHFKGKDGNEFAAIHNGVLSEFGRRSRSAIKDDKSDSRLFTEKVLTPIALHDPDALFENRPVKTFMEVGIGKWNKVCILDSTGRFNILNEGQGDWIQEDGGKVWYSNDSWKLYSGDQEGRFRGRTMGPNESGGVVGRVGEGKQLLLPKPGEAAGGGEVIQLPIKANSYIAGKLAAQHAEPFDEGAGDYWREGYIDHIKQSFEDPMFYEGYSDAILDFPQRRLQDVTDKEQRAKRIYDLGYLWGRFEWISLPSDTAREELATEILESLGENPPPKAPKLTLGH